MYFINIQILYRFKMYLWWYWYTCDPSTRHSYLTFFCPHSKSRSRLLKTFCLLMPPHLFEPWLSPVWIPARTLVCPASGRTLFFSPTPSATTFQSPLSVPSLTGSFAFSLTHHICFYHATQRQNVLECSTSTHSHDFS